METFYFSKPFTFEGLNIIPVHVRIEKLRHQIPAHQHSQIGYEFHYTESGHGSVIIDGKAYEIEKGTFYVTGPGVVHAQFSSEEDPIIEYCIYLECKQKGISKMNPLKLFVDTTFWFGKDWEHIYYIMLQLIQENRNPGIDTELVSEVLLKQFIIMVTRTYRNNSNQKSAPHSHMNTRVSLIPLIDDMFCYQYQDLRLSGLADLLNLSVRQTQRLIKENFGKTFSQKLTEARMAAAEQMLLNSDLSITEISERLGYASIEYFSGVFRRLKHCSPSKFRTDAKNRALDDGSAPTD